MDYCPECGAILRPGTPGCRVCAIELDDGGTDAVSADVGLDGWDRFEATVEAVRQSGGYDPN